jgi:hypothetical protein
MPRSLGRCMQTSFARVVTYWLASVAIVVRMTVTPIPIRPLLPAVRFSKTTMRSVILLEILTIGTVFVVIPIVIVLVVTVVDPAAVTLAAMVFFSTSVVLLPGRSTHCRRHSKDCSKNKGTEKISTATVHVFFSWLEIPISETPASKESAVVIEQKMFDTAHLLKSFEFTPDHRKTLDLNLVESIKNRDPPGRLLTASLSSHRGPCPLRTAGFRWYRLPSDNWQLLR